jgi:putative DNA primase/helicase
LPELLEAIANEQTVFIAEGEKGVDALVWLGAVATCSPMGAGKWRDDYSRHFKGAKVVILPDNDKPGGDHAAQVEKSLSGIAASVRTISLPGLPEAGDVYDWIKSGGKADALWRLVENTKAETSEAFTLTCLASVETVAIDWIWEAYLARGKLALLGGDPDQGKSMMTIAVAARLSNGHRWPPHKERAPIGSTIFICSEDGVADTVRPRAEAAGADLSKIFVFKSSLLKGGRRKTFSLKEDLELLSEAIKSVGDVQLIVIDAVTSYMGAIDSHKTSDVRAVLEPLADFAERHRVAILGVTHPPKQHQGNSLRSFAGSFAFVEAPRLAHFVTTDPDNPERKLLLPVKNNIGRKALGIGYSIQEKVVSNNVISAMVVWDDAPVDYTADQALAAHDDGIAALRLVAVFRREPDIDMLAGPMAWPVRNV